MHCIKTQTITFGVKMKRKAIILVMSLVVLYMPLSTKAVEHNRFCKVASYTFMGLIEDIEASDPKYRLGEIICKAGDGLTLPPI